MTAIPTRENRNPSKISNAYYMNLKEHKYITSHSHGGCKLVVHEFMSNL